MDEEKEDVTSEKDTETTDETVTDSAEEKEVPKFTEAEKKLYARAKKAEAASREYKEKLDALSKQPKPEPLPNQTVSEVEKFYAVKDLDRDEFTTLSTEAKDLGVDGFKYINSPAGQARLQSIRDKKKSEEATPATGTRSPIFQKYSEDELRSLPSSELEKILPR